MTTHVTMQICEKGPIRASDFFTLKRCSQLTHCVIKQLSSNLVTMLVNFVKRIANPQNFRAIAQLQAKLCLPKSGKLDACIKPLFVNPVI